jgi:Zn finger protein HypA/HybF involved in hydrogenase expression
VNPTPLIRSLDQEVLAVLRGASLECLVCGEFVQHRLGVIACPECGSAIQTDGEGKLPRLQSEVQAG